MGRFNGNSAAGCWGFGCLQTLATALLNALGYRGLLPHHLLLSPPPASPSREPPKLTDPSSGMGLMPSGSHQQHQVLPWLCSAPASCWAGKRWINRGKAGSRAVPSHPKSALDLLNILEQNRPRGYFQAKAANCALLLISKVSPPGQMNPRQQQEQLLTAGTNYPGVKTVLNGKSRAEEPQAFGAWCFQKVLNQNTAN